jgi:hypothetical protein
MNMTLKEFVEKYDKQGTIVLLEGKRKVLGEDVEKIERFGRLITEQTQYIVFRSGNALGADYYFSKGVSSVDSKRLQVITPYTGHRKETNYAYKTFSLDEVNLLSEPEVVYQSKKHKSTKDLVDKYVSGERDSISMKAAYIIRDTVKVTGLEGTLLPATFAFFYVDLANPESGGTGHTIQVCRMNDVLFVNQSVWMSWLDEIGCQ